MDAKEKKEPPVVADLKVKLASKDAVIKAKDETIAAKNEVIIAKDEIIRAKDAAIKAKDDLLAGLQQHPAVFWNDAAASAGSSAVEDLLASVNALDANRVSNKTAPFSIAPTSIPTSNKRIKSSAKAASPTLPHGALETEVIIIRSLSFLDLPDFSAGARTCRAWSLSAKCTGNAYWRAIARFRWSKWATAMEAELGKSYDFRAACKDKLRDENHRLVQVWRERTISIWSGTDLFEGRPKDVPQISWLSYKGHITGTLAALSALSQDLWIPAPVFKRYENAAQALYEGASYANGGSVKNLPPILSNVSNQRRREHERARSVVKAIYFKSDGSLMDEKPNFSYRNEVVLYYAGTNESLSPAQVLDGITKLRSTEEAE